MREVQKTLTETTGFSIVEDRTSKRGKADTWGVIRKEDKYVGSNLMGRLLMELRDKGKLEYELPADIFDFITQLKNAQRL